MIGNEQTSAVVADDLAGERLFIFQDLFRVFPCLRFQRAHIGEDHVAVVVLRCNDIHRNFLPHFQFSEYIGRN